MRDDQAERTRRTIHESRRKAALFTVGFLALAVALAVLGSAGIAWILSTTGLPFLRTWLVVAAVVLGVPALGLLVRELRR